MISGLEQIEDNLKRGYRSAVLGFVKSRVTGNTSYFIEITRGALTPVSDRIFMTKHDYIFAQELLDKYDEMHRIEKDKEKERKLKAKEEKKLREQEIAERLEKIDDDIKNFENDNLKFIDGKMVDVRLDEEDEEDEEDPIEDDPKSELILGDDTPEIIEDETDMPETESNLYNEDKQKGEIDEPNQPRVG